jgi:hypothetical protein
MSERPGVVLGALLTLAASCALALVVALVELGGDGLVALASTVLGAFSACLFFLAELQQVPLAALTLVTLVLASLGAFGRALVGSVRQQRLLGSLPLERVRDQRLLRVARAAGLEELWVTSARRPAAFCFGLLHPRVVVTRGLLDRLQPDEQEAAIWHEAQHARQREPLRCLLARLAAKSFFWLPALNDLCDRYLLVKELDADRLAASRTSRQALAGALWEVAIGPVPAGAVGLGELAGARVDRLLDPAARLPPAWRQSRLSASAACVAALAVIAAFPAQLDLAACTQLRSMLVNGSLHGLPGMAIGFALDALIVFSIAKLVRRRLLAAQRWNG